MVFADTKGSEIEGVDDQIVSGGNFHGEYPAKVPVLHIYNNCIHIGL